jgi:ribosomal protein S18 acetylase RimI-like enzyme
MVTLQPISAPNALVFKTVRLRALQDSPTAFGSTYARESQISDEEWVERSLRWTRGGSMGYLAFEGDICCGLVACYTEGKSPDRGHIVSMWVDPAYRRSGVGQALIDGIRTWGTSLGLRELTLMVTSVNTRAIRFYERLGFRMTGITAPYPNDPVIIEHEMTLQLRA